MIFHSAVPFCTKHYEKLGKVDIYILYLFESRLQMNIEYQFYLENTENSVTSNLVTKP